MNGKSSSTVLCLSACFFSGLALGKEGPAEFTFLFWPDQELRGGEDDISRLRPIIDAMNTIAGKAYPESIGGTVAVPDFIASGGDTTA